MTYTTDQLSKVSFSDALQRLDDVRDVFTERFLRGEVSVWVGSMISNARYPDLGKLLTTLLDNLHDYAVDCTNPEDPARWTIDQIMEITDISGGDRTIRFSDWSDNLKAEVIDSLWNQYSKVLGMRFAPEGMPTSLMWDVLHIEDIYDDSSVNPDAEHRLLALLILEGVLCSLVTTNWDPLIEDAFEQASEPLNEASLKTIVRPCDISQSGGQPSLTKMHGCVRVAKHDESARNFVVGTEQQVRAWPSKPEIGPIKDYVTTISRAFQVLYVGLSGQDINIQQQHIEAGLFAETDYSINGPRIVFAHGNLEDPRASILEAAYGTEVYQAEYAAIREKALVPLFAKPLLGALYAYVIREKLRAFARALPDPNHKSLAARGVEALFTHFATIIDSVSGTGSSPAEVRRWRFVSDEGARFVSSFVRMYKNGKAVNSRWHYHALPSNASTNPEPSYYRLALLIGILVKGQNQGRWKLSLVIDRPEQLILHSPLGEEIPVFITCDKMVSVGPLTFTIPDPEKPHLVIVAQGQDSSIRKANNPTVSRLSRLDPMKRIERYLDIWLEHPDPVVAFHDELCALSFAKPLSTTP